MNIVVRHQYLNPPSALDQRIRAELELFERRFGHIAILVRVRTFGGRVPFMAARHCCLIAVTVRHAPMILVSAAGDTIEQAADDALKKLWRRFSIIHRRPARRQRMTLMPAQLG
jgi:hypothetical protein